MKSFFILIAILSALSEQHLHSQQSKTDSLLTLLKKDNAPLSSGRGAGGEVDTNKVNHLNALGWELMNSNPDTAIILGEQALELCTNPKSQILIPKSFLANTLSQLGVYYWLKADYPQALDYYFKALKLDEELGNKTGIAKRLGNIGIVYEEQADYPKALDYYFKALKLDEELENKNGIARHLGNIGIVYWEQANSEQRIANSENNPNRLSLIADNYNKALDYYFRRMKLDEESGNKNNMAINLGNIGNVYEEQGKSEKSKVKSDSLYTKALDYYFRAQKMYEELGAKNDIAINLGNIGSLYTDTKKYKEAEKYLLDALKLDKEIGAQNDERIFEEALSNLYEKMGEESLKVAKLQSSKVGTFQLSNFRTFELFKLALEHYKKAMVLKDTLFSAESKKQMVRKEMNYEFEKKEAAAKAEADKQQAVAEAEANKQRVVLILVTCALCLVLAFAFLIFRALRITQKQKKVIEQQKKVVEEKQEEILASIRYAKRIQDSILPTEKYIEKSLNRLKAKMPK